MNRNKFLKTCGLVCVGGTSIAILLQSCAGQYFAASSIEGKYLKVLLSEFVADSKGKPVNRKYVLVKSDKLNFPIYLYKLNDNQYSALWMECTHQGAELSVHGDFLSCPSHGSEFDKLGTVVSGPASANLRSFSTHTDNQYIYIQLS